MTFVLCCSTFLACGGGKGATPTTPTPTSERLSPFDIEALQAVYGSSVAIGAGRAQFVAAGLVRP